MLNLDQQLFQRVVNQVGSSGMSSEILYPDPQLIPVPPSPSYQQPIPLVTLSELISGKYVSTTARVVYIRTITSFCHETK
jgi:hypothetical protein